LVCLFKTIGYKWGIFVFFTLVSIVFISFSILEDLGNIRVIPMSRPVIPCFLWGYTIFELNTQTLIKDLGDRMSQHDTLLAAFETYKAENEKFIEKGVKASAARARKALQEIAGACKERRKEITAAKEAMEAKK
jgi:hypothetical protein